MTAISLKELAAKLKLELVGDGEALVNSVSSTELANSNQVTFLTDKKYLAALQNCKAGAVIIHPDLADHYSGNKLLAANPYLSYALTAQLLDTTPAIINDRANAYIAADASVDKTASIASGAVIESGAVIGQHSQIGNGVVVGKNSQVGQYCKLYPNVTIYHDVVIGDNCILHAGAVIGSDGFGFANDKGQWVKIPQLGRVVIENDVEIGANSTIDRGALQNTIIRNGVKIDNLVHLAHNVEIDENSAIAATAAIAGSTKIGKRCTFAGGVGVNGHIEIGDDVHFTGMSMVTKSFNEAGVYSSGQPATANKEWRKNSVQVRKIDTLYDRVKALEAKLAEFESK